jgi:DNA-binding CsgD family transcriptional regulator
MSAQPDTAEVHLGQAIAALATGSFPHAIRRWIEHHLAFDNFTVLAFYQNQVPDILATHSLEPKVHARIQTDYRSRAYLLDPFHELHVQQAPPGAYWLSETAPDKFMKHQYYLDYYRGTAMLDEAVFHAMPSSGVSVQITLGRDSTSQRKFSRADIRQARRIAPIVCALATAQWSALKSAGVFDETTVLRQLADAVRDVHGIGLSPRQSEVALLVLRGHSTVSIGLRLGISPQTVKVLRRQLYRKCAISSQAELFALLFPLLGAPRSGLTAPVPGHDG